jgi:prepilin-type N-terminal cleavage/methylation domain-containing protein
MTQYNSFFRQKKITHDKRGVTLIEVLIVISIIFVLFGITAKVTDGVQQRAEKTKAQAQLAILAQALENYYAYYGDYPWIESKNGATELYQALIGNRRPTGNFRMIEHALHKEVDPLANKKGPVFITLDQMNLWAKPIPQLPKTLDTQNKENYFVDPWGLPYVYKYKKAYAGAKGHEWEKYGYVLMSHGFDQDPSLKIPDNGICDQIKHDPRAADNLFQE